MQIDADGVVEPQPRPDIRTCNRRAIRMFGHLDDVEPAAPVLPRTMRRKARRPEQPKTRFHGERRRDRHICHTRTALSGAQSGKLVDRNAGAEPRAPMDDMRRRADCAANNQSHFAGIDAYMSHVVFQKRT